MRLKNTFATSSVEYYKSVPQGCTTVPEEEGGKQGEVAGAPLPFSHSLNGGAWLEESTRLLTGYQDPCIVTISSLPSFLTHLSQSQAFQLHCSSAAVSYTCKLCFREAVDLTRQRFSNSGGLFTSTERFS